MFFLTILSSNKNLKSYKSVLDMWGNHEILVENEDLWMKNFKTIKLNNVLLRSYLRKSKSLKKKSEFALNNCPISGLFQNF
jgi:hypothetical protein